MSTTTSSTTSVPTGTTGAGGGNMLRITGLNTGLDVDAMVKKMLTSDQTKIDQAKQAQQLIEWKQEAYQSIIKDVKDLQSAYFDITNSSNCLLSSGNYNNMVASSSDATVVDATASTTSAAGSYKVLVKQLAASANTVGSNKVVLASDGTTAATSSTKLTDLGLTAGTYSLNLTYGNSQTTTVDFKITSTSTINDLATAIKTQTNGAVTAKLDDLTGKFSIQTSATGSSSNLTINTDTGSVLSKLGMSNYTLGTTENGNDALFAIKEPGSNNYIGGENSSNKFVVNGVSYSLSDVNTTASISAGSVVTPNSGDIPASISVSQDTSKVKDLITNFMDKYNNLVGELQDKLSEKKDYDYKPLTDTQKSSMSDTDITNWETKAKQGVLRNDDNLQNLLNDLTSAFNTPVVDSSGNKVSTLYFGSYGANSIGIDTSNDVTQGGKISITDDTKFTDAITNHADEIMKLFTTTSDSDDKTTKFNQSGIFQRIDQILDDNVGMIGTSYNDATLTKYANIQDDKSAFGGSGDGTLPDQIYQKQLLINDLTSTMSDDQTKYYNQFTQLETTMEELNSQQSVISSYFS